MNRTQKNSTYHHVELQPRLSSEGKSPHGLVNEDSSHTVQKLGTMPTNEQDLGQKRDSTQIGSDPSNPQFRDLNGKLPIANVDTIPQESEQDQDPKNVNSDSSTQLKSPMMRLNQNFNLDKHRKEINK